MPRGIHHERWVGRVAELAVLGASLANRSSVVVTGEAGVGKSALIARALDLRGERSVHCRCFRSLVRAAGAALQLGLETPVPVGDELWTAQWVRRQLGRRVLVVEDLQWADELTLAVVERLVPLVPVVVSVRTGDLGSAEALAAVGASQQLALDPLGPAEALALAGALHPNLRREELHSLAGRSDGNPLLLEELGADDEHRGLRQATVGRLRRCGEDAWRGFATLSRAGEPLPAAWLVGVPALEQAGLVVIEGDLVRPRHALVAQVLSAHLDQLATAGEIDLALAGCAHRAGWLVLAARLYADVGDRAQAHACATAAASSAARPGVRAEMLRLAALHAPAHDARLLAEEAVLALVQAGEYAAAARLLDRLPERHDALWLSLVGRIHWQIGDDQRALQALATGVGAAVPGSPTDVVLRCEHARALALTGGDLDQAMELAEQAVSLAERTGAERVRASSAIGTVGYFRGDRDHLERLRRGVRLLEDDAVVDVGVQFTLMNNLVVALESAGELEEAVGLADRAAARAEELRLRGWSQQLTALATNLSVHRGDYGSVLVRGLPALDDIADQRTVDQLEVSVGLALVDLGRLDEARARIQRALTTCADDMQGRGSLLWLSAEERIWSGQHEQAIGPADQALVMMTGPLRHIVAVTAQHARCGAGRPPADIELSDLDLPVVAAVPHEVAGLRARAARDPAARAHFSRAAELWAGRHRRGEQRCRWLAADVAEHKGAEAEQALTELGRLELELSAEGWLPLLGLVRRSLRERGVRRSAPRGRSGDLTLREREVLDLIGQGLSNEAIAVRLGLSPATVAAQVASARARLGAASRWQAASD